MIDLYEKVKRDLRLGDLLAGLERPRKEITVETQERPLPRILFTWWDK